jgi:hypothetical protein
LENTEMNAQIVWEPIEADKVALAKSMAAREILQRSARRVVLHFFNNQEIGARKR